MPSDIHDVDDDVDVVTRNDMKHPTKRSAVRERAEMGMERMTSRTFHRLPAASRPREMVGWVFGWCVLHTHHVAVWDPGGVCE